jgi:DNA/RNA endonuclease YhcR with UshA esterase domain
VVSVKGVYEESNGRSRVRYTELIKTGAAAVVVDTVALAALDVASWDGCLVRVALVVVTNPAVDSYTWEVATQAEPSGARLLIDTLLYAPTVAQNDTFDSITGVVFPWQSGDTQLFSLVPRDAADLVGQASQFLSTTAKAIQNGEVAAQSAVELSVVVTAVQADGDYTHFWAQDAGGGAKSGLYFFDERVAPTPLDVVPGDVVTVRGVYSERNNRTTVSFTEVQETGTAAPTVDTLNIADLNAALWEGCLVKVEAVTVSNPAVDANTWQVRPTADPTGATLLVDHLLFQATVAMGDTFNSISGVVFAWGTATPQTFSLAPRDAADLVGQAGGKLTTTAAALQAGEVAQGSRVRVSGLVLSATKGTSPRDAFAEAEGVGLFLFDARTTVTAPYERGDVVTVEGVYDEYNGRTTVRFASIEVTGHTALAPKLLDRFALDLSQHESTLVRVQNLKAVADWSGYTIAMGDAQGTATDTLVTIEEYASTLDLISTDRFASVVGVVFCTTSGCNLSPRDNDDLGPTTITELRSGAIALDVRARIAEAVVFAARPFGAALDFYAQAEGGGEKSGLYFVDYDNVAPPVFTPGDVFQFVGKYKTKNGYPRFYYSSASDTGRDAVLVPSVVPLAALQAKATAEPYLQGLCTVTDVVVVESPVTVGVSTVGFRVRAAAGTDTLVVNTSLFAPTVALDQHLGSVTGFINEPVNNATHPVELFVRSAADVVE